MVFLVLLAVLWKFAWKPLAKGLDNREKLIADQISEAEQTNQQARQLLADYQQKLADSKQEVRGILDQGRREAEARPGVARPGQERDPGRCQRSLQQIEAATAVLEELAERGATLAVDLAGKIVGSRLNADNHAQLIRKAVAEFTAEKR